MKEVSHKKLYVRNPDTEEFEPLMAIRGENAYEIAVRLGKFTGTEEEWANYIEIERAAAVKSVEDKGAETLESIPDDYTALAEEVAKLETDKIDKSNIAQELGDSEEKVLSQKAVTKHFGNIPLLNGSNITWSDGNFVKYTNGNSGESPTYSESEKIAIKGASSIQLCSYIQNDESGYAFYDIDGVYITGSNTSAKNGTMFDIAVPDGAELFAFTVLTEQKENTRVAFLGVYDKIDGLTKFTDHELMVKPSLEWFDGYFTNHHTGKEAPVSVYSHTDYFNVYPFKTIRLKTFVANDDSGYAFYDKNKAYIDGANTYAYNGFDMEIDIPENAVYCQFTCYLDKVSYSSVELFGGVVGLQEISKSINEVVSESKNITWFDGYVVNYNNGKHGTVDAYSSTDYIDIFPYNHIAVCTYNENDTSGIAFYDECKRYISGQNLSNYKNVEHTIDVPQDAVYVCYSCIGTHKDRSYLKVVAECSATETKSLTKRLIATRNKLKDNMLWCSVNMFNSIAGIGDSFTEASTKNSNGDWENYPDNSWIAVLSKRAGVNYKNYGKGGATTGSWINDKLPIVLADEPCDFYILALGQNDINANVTVGSVDDIHDDYTQNPNTLFGNYGQIISRIKEHAPNAKFVMVASWVILSVNGNTYQQNDWVIKEIGDHFGIPTIYPFDDEFFNSELYTSYLSSNHPTLMGHTGMGLAMERLISKCIRDNPNYFMYGTIG